MSAAEAEPAAGSGAEPARGLYVHLPFCVSICPYCDFVVYAGADARGTRNRVDAPGRRPDRRDRPAGRGRRSRPAGPPAEHGLPRWRHALAHPGRGPRADPRRGADRVRDRRRCGDHPRGQPGARRTRQSRGPGGCRDHPPEPRRPVVLGERAQAPGPAPLGERHRRRPDRRARGGDPLDQPRPALRRARPDAEQLGRRARAGDRPGPRPPLALRPDPRRSRGRGPDRAGR